MSRPGTPRLHHFGIQTADLDNCLRWYLDFFDAQQNWSMDRFSELTRSRLPGIRRLIEVQAGDLRFHLFDREGHTGCGPDAYGFQFQHACIQLATLEDLAAMRDRWIELHASGRYTFARTDGPTNIVVDDDGTESVYLYDVNGLEYEFTCMPAEPR